MNVVGKKLLVLGGNSISSDIVKIAQSMGVYTIVTDWNDIEKSPAKSIADEYWNVSLMDYDQLVRLATEKHIDGVLTGYTDSYLVPYYILCKRLNLPCYGTQEQFELLHNKETFKKICVENKVPVVPEYDIETFDPAIISEKHKIIIKPVDNSGSRGISICSNEEQYKTGLETALANSTQKKVIIERFMECDDVSLTYTIQDGNISLSAICDRYIYQTPHNGSVTSGLIYPSKYTSTYLQDTNDVVIKMFQNVGLKNGVLFMQAFVENGKFYFYEMGYRLSGGRHYIFTEHQNNIHAIKQLVNFAITGKMAEYYIANSDNPHFHQICCQLSVLCKRHPIAQILGEDRIRFINGIIDYTSYYKEGATVGQEGTTAQIFARIHIVANTKGELQTILSQIKETLQVLDESGDNLVLDFFEY